MQSADPDCTGSKSRQYIQWIQPHFGTGIYLYWRGSLPIPTDQLSSIDAKSSSTPHPPHTLYITYYFMVAVNFMFVSFSWRRKKIKYQIFLVNYNVVRKTKYLKISESCIWLKIWMLKYCKIFGFLYSMLHQPEPWFFRGSYSRFLLSRCFRSVMDGMRQRVGSI